MNILSEIEGLRGEDLSSAILRLILIRSQEFREEFLDLLWRGNDEQIVCKSVFKCEREVITDVEGTGEYLPCVSGNVHYFLKHLFETRKQGKNAYINQGLIIN